MTVRLNDWEARLAAYLDANAARPFAYGTFDCCLFAGGAIEAMTGAAVLKDWRGRYRTEIGAARALRRRGHDTVNGPFTALLGDPVGVLALGRGDVVSDGGNIGVRWGAAALFVTDDGLQMEPLARVRHGWRVPHG